jgi:hypothetical protein
MGPAPCFTATGNAGIHGLSLSPWRPTSFCPCGSFLPDRFPSQPLPSPPQIPSPMSVAGQFKGLRSCAGVVACSLDLIGRSAERRDANRSGNRGCWRVTLDLCSPCRARHATSGPWVRIPCEGIARRAVLLLSRLDRGGQCPATDRRVGPRRPSATSAKRTGLSKTLGFPRGSILLVGPDAWATEAKSPGSLGLLLPRRSTPPKTFPRDSPLRPGHDPASDF